MPVDVIVEPVKLSMLETKSVKIEIKPKICDLLSKRNSNYRIELRGLRLDKIPFKNAWPSYGSLGLNGSDWSHTLTLPEREMSRKRKDEIFDLTPYFKSKARKSHLLTLTKKKHPPNHEKNEDRFSYVIGLFLVKSLDLPQIIEYHKKFEMESFLSTYNTICERLFPNKDEDDVHVISNELKIPMR